MNKQSSMLEKDIEELRETIEMINTEALDQAIVSEFSFGNYVVIPEKLFKQILKESNSEAIKTGDLEEGVELVLFSEKLPDDEVGEND